MLKRMLLLPLLFFLVMPLSAQHRAEKADSVYEFRFIPLKNTFFVPFKDNEPELQRLYQVVNQYKSEITSGTLPLYVDGYCSSFKSDKKNLRIAKSRSNQVKSQLILHADMKEAYFITHNHNEGGDFVTVKLVFPTVVGQAVTEPVTENAAGQEAQTVEPATEPTKVQPTEESAIQSTETAIAQTENSSDKPYTLSLRANLLRWATLTPDLGIEWRMSRSMGVVVNGSWTSWSWDNKNRRYALWEVTPEVRYYIGKEKRGHIGAMYKVGQFNYKLSTTGKEGDIMGGGITAGYQLRLNNKLSLDLGLGLGYIHADYDKYEVIDNVRVRKMSETKNWWGPVSAGVTLMWNLY